MKKRPNFFLVGAPKAGSTSLYRYMEQHPQIYMSPIKEPHHLADEIRFENFSEGMKALSRPRLAAMREYLDGPVTEKFSGGHIADWNDYCKLFARVTTETAIGDASICYLWSPSAPANIARLFPDARILIVLRDPADRLFSQYVHMLGFAAKHISFREHLAASRAYSLASANPRIGELYPFLDFGFYHRQLSRYLALFPRERIHIGFYEDFQRDPVLFIQTIFRFLGVDSGFVPDLGERHMLASVPQNYFLNTLFKRVGLWDAVRDVLTPAFRRRIRRLVYRPRAEMKFSQDDRERVIGYYRDDIEKLQHLLGRDLSTWLSAERRPLLP